MRAQLGLPERIIISAVYAPRPEDAILRLNEMDPEALHNAHPDADAGVAPGEIGLFDASQVLDQFIRNAVVLG